MFVASMNPCPCGYYGDPTHRCVCTPGQIQRYMNKISGPLLDRIDIQCEISPVPFKDISKAAPGEPSAKNQGKSHQGKGDSGRKIQGLQRNPLQCPDDRTNDSSVCRTRRSKASNLLRMAMEKLSLSARAYNRILKVARTIADLAGSEQSRASTSGRSHRISDTRQGRLGRKRTLLRQLSAKTYKKIVQRRGIFYCTGGYFLLNSPILKTKYTPIT